MAFSFILKLDGLVQILVRLTKKLISYTYTFIPPFFFLKKLLLKFKKEIYNYIIFNSIIDLYIISFISYFHILLIIKQRVSIREKDKEKEINPHSTIHGHQSSSNPSIAKTNRPTLIDGTHPVEFKIWDFQGTEAFVCPAFFSYQSHSISLFFPSLFHAFTSYLQLVHSSSIFYGGRCIVYYLLFSR